MKSSLVLIFFILLSSCKVDQSNSKNGINSGPSDKNDGQIYTGLDIDGNYRSCLEISGETACTLIFGPEEEYSSECEANGDKSITCDCHDYICVDENLDLPVYGKDIDGNMRSCEGISKDIACTEIFTEEDQFALDCEQEGGTAFQCGCHDFICIE